MKNIFLALLLVTNVSFAVTANKVWRIPSGGTKPTWGPVNLADGTNGVTGALPSKTNLPLVGLQTSSSVSFTSSSTSFVDVTNATITITTEGRPVYLGFIPASNSANNGIGFNSNSAQSGQVNIQLVRGATTVTRFAAGTTLATGTTNVSSVRLPPSSFWYIDSPAAGTYTYKIQADAQFGTETIFFQDVLLIAYEI